MADSRQAGSLWTPEEDVTLLKHVAKYGTKHWGYLQTSGVLPHRDQKACCNRFILLKRKFFQARAKGQRLCFPAVPQPLDLKASSSGLPASPSSLRPSSSTGFKRTSSASPNSAVSIKRTASSQHISGIEAAVSGNEGPSACGYHVEKPRTLQRSVDSLPQSLVHVSQVVPERVSLSGSFGAYEAVVPSSVGVRSAKRSLPTAAVIPKMEASLDVVCLDDKESIRPVTEEAQQAAPKGIRSLAASPAAASSFPAAGDHTRSQQPDTLDSLTQGLPSANSLQSAMWRCFNPALVEAVWQEMEMNMVDNLAYLDQEELGSCQGGMAPDALLDQIASAPARMLFGQNNNSPLPPSPPESSPARPGEGLWQSSSAAVADLWDLLRTTAAT